MGQGGFIQLNSKYVLHCLWANGQRSATNEISVLLVLVIVYLREVETFDPVRAYFPFRHWLHYDSVPTNALPLAKTAGVGRSCGFRTAAVARKRPSMHDIPSRHINPPADNAGHPLNHADMWITDPPWPNAYRLEEFVASEVLHSSEK